MPAVVIKTMNVHYRGPLMRAKSSSSPVEPVALAVSFRHHNKPVVMLTDQHPLLDAGLVQRVAAPEVFLRGLYRYSALLCFRRLGDRDFQDAVMAGSRDAVSVRRFGQ